MSPLTKTFVVLLVVMSLLSAAGFVVFVNQAQHFREAIAAAEAKGKQSDANLATAKSQALALVAQVAAAQKETDAALTENTRLANADAATISDLKGQIATAHSQATITAATTDSVAAALAASEAQRKGLGDALAASRTELDTANKRQSDSDIAISDLTNKLDVSNRKVTDFSEQVAQGKADGERYLKILQEHGLSPTAAPETLSLSVPPINGVVRDARPINGIPYATISVGSAEQVTKGMTFHVIDRKNAQFLGNLVIDSVDLHEATGKLEGPSISDVRVGTDVRTQL